MVLNINQVHVEEKEDSDFLPEISQQLVENF